MSLFAHLSQRLRDHNITFYRVVCHLVLVIGVASVRQQVVAHGAGPAQATREVGCAAELLRTRAPRPAVVAASLRSAITATRHASLLRRRGAITCISSCALGLCAACVVGGWKCRSWKEVGRRGGDDAMPCNGEASPPASPPASPAASRPHRLDAHPPPRFVAPRIAASPASHRHPAATLPCPAASRFAARLAVRRPPRRLASPLRGLS